MAWNHDKGTCWYNDKVCFIGVPKNASVTIREGLNLNRVSNYLTNRDSLNHLKLISVIRNPLDRFLSSYYELDKRGKLNMDNIRDRKFYNMTESKERFIQFLSEVEEEFFDCHVEEQVFYLTDENGNTLPFDELIEFDRLSESNYVITDKKNPSPNDFKKMVLNYLDDDLIERIKKLYKNDFNFIVNDNI